MADVDPDSTPGYSGAKEDGKALLADLDDELGELQEKLFAESRFGGRKRILLILERKVGKTWKNEGFVIVTVGQTTAQVVRPGVAVGDSGYGATRLTCDPVVPPTLPGSARAGSNRYGPVLRLAPLSPRRRK